VYRSDNRHSEKMRRDDSMRFFGPTNTKQILPKQVRAFREDMLPLVMWKPLAPDRLQDSLLVELRGDTSRVESLPAIGAPPNASSGQRRVR
jgi:hypothetical protein